MAEKSTQQQPLQAPQMAYTPGGAPSEANGNGHAHQHNGNGAHAHRATGPKWSNSFWSCFQPVDLCCFAYWCPCVLFGKTHHRLQEPAMQNYSIFNTYCCGWLALAYCGGFHCILQTINRGNMREQLGIEGNGLTDCLGSWCCPCCGLIQEEKEAVLRTEGGAAGYQQQPQMSYN